jgi:hypothetical protein
VSPLIHRIGISDIFEKSKPKQVLNKMRFIHYLINSTSLFRINNIFSYYFIMTKFSRTSNGRYSVSGHTYDSLIGTRAQVWHGTAYKTSGGLTKTNLMKNKSGRIVSRSKHITAKKEKRLVKAGFLTKKGHFGFIKNGSKKGSKKMRGGTGSAVGSGFPKGSPIGRSLIASGGSKGKRGGNGVNYSLSPSKISGITATSGPQVQIIAGQGN